MNSLCDLTIGGGGFFCSTHLGTERPRRPASFPLSSLEQSSRPEAWRSFHFHDKELELWGELATLLSFLLDPARVPGQHFWTSHHNRMDGFIPPYGIGGEGKGEGLLSSPLLSPLAVEDTDHRNPPTMPPVATATIRHLLCGGLESAGLVSLDGRQ